jgi:transposase
VERYTTEIDALDRQIHHILKDDAGYVAVQSIYGVGKVFAAVFVAEIGDVTRFDSPRALCSWAGLTPKHRESDTHVYRGRITKQGSRLVRWAAIEAVARYHGGAAFTEQFHAIAERRGHTKANVAIARKSSHACLLRTSRRGDPMSRSSQGGVKLGRGQLRARLIARLSPKVTQPSK